MIIFPEGTRTITERMIDDPKFGAGYIIYQAKPVVIPLYHNGTEKILPVGATKFSLSNRFRLDRQTDRPAPVLRDAEREKYLEKNIGACFSKTFGYGKGILQSMTSWRHWRPI